MKIKHESAEEFRRKTAEAEAILAQDQSEFIESSERVRRSPNPNPTPPISLRLSEPLLSSLDRIAETQHRKRANLIQHILWEYVIAQRAAADPQPIESVR